MSQTTRRDFLAAVGGGMFVAGVGYGVALELGLSTARADETSSRLTFGKWQPLVDLLCETPLDRFQATVVEQLRRGVSMRELIGATALANARTFGGEDYVGMHTLMALAPAYQMSQDLSGERLAALPVLKVLYRHARRFHETGGDDTLRPVTAQSPASSAAEAIWEATQRGDLAAAERILASSAGNSAETAFNDLLETVEEAPEVHRIVLAHRAWDMLDFLGHDHALTMLRQSVHYCVKHEQVAARHFSEPRTLLPRLLDQYQLPRQATECAPVDDAWVGQMSETLFASTPAQAADAAAAALAEGVPGEMLGYAISVAANQLVLRDAGRSAQEAQPGKPAGSVHGDSIGVHASDSAHAWRGIAAASNPRNRSAALIMAAYQVAQDRVRRGGDFQNWQPRPIEEDLARIQENSPTRLLERLEAAIRDQDQAAASAVTHKYGKLGFDPQGVRQICLKYAISEDGALHAEKYYRTASDEFARLPAKYRWDQLVALARVTASGFGNPAPGLDEARRLLDSI